MPLNFNDHTPSFQSDQEMKWSKAEVALSEGLQLYREGSKNSLEQALQKLEQARQLFHSIKNPSREAFTLATIGKVHHSLSEKQKALVYYEQALPLFHAANEPLNAAYTFSSIGQAYNDLGEKQKALNYYAQALSLFHANFDDRSEAVIATRIGTIHDYLGEKQKALENFAHALLLFSANQDHDNEAITLNNIGKVYDDLGEKQKALDVLVQSLRLSQGVNDHQQAIALNAIGKIYLDLGEEEKALESYTKALPIFQAINDRQGEAYVLVGFGKVYDNIDLPRKALESYSQALPIFEAIADYRGEAYTLNNIGVVYGNLRDSPNALNSYLRALPLFHNIADHQGEALALNNVGAVYNDLGEPQKALDNLKRSLSLYRALSASGGEARALLNLAISNHAQGKLIEARTNIEAAIAIIESLRTKITNQDFRSSYFATVQGYYRFYIELLMRLHKQHPTDGHDGEALQASERARARALLETLTEANADIRQGVDPKLVERERVLQQRLNGKAHEQMRLLGSVHTEEQARVVAQQLGALTAEFRQVETEIRQTSPRYAALTQPQPLTLREIQTQVLDADTLLLEYSLGKERSYLWAVTPDSIKTYVLPKREEIETAARRVYAILSARNQRIEGETQAQREARIAQADAQYAEAGTQLSRMVLALAAAQLGDKRLLIVGDGALQYIPFAALPDPAGAVNSAPLVVKHEIVHLPSASTISVQRSETKDRKPAIKTVAVLADPVFELDDERVKTSAAKSVTKYSQTDSLAVTQPSPAPSTSQLVQEFTELAKGTGIASRGWRIPRLPGTREEAAQILALVPATEGKQAIDFAASRATATSSDISQFRYLHFATHGFLDSLRPELSGIVLSMVDEQGKPQDGFLRAHEIFNLKLPAELVVLSACQTGLGKEIQGEGLVSLTRGFMYAGALRVVVSLWSVSDRATAELMTRFYRGMLRDGKRPAAALRDAQVSLMNDKRWAAPFYWAPFILQGEWR